jgi:hypothetical protein
VAAVCNQTSLNGVARRLILTGIIASGVCASAFSGEASYLAGQSAVSQPSQEPPSVPVNAAPKNNNPPPAYKPLRFEEDYRYLRDPSNRIDRFDSLKYIPLLGDIRGSEDAYLSLGGETRQRYEMIRNELFGLARSNPRGFNHAYLQRYLLHADYHPTEQLRFFGQLKSGQEDGRAAGPRPDIDENAFDINQGFFDWHEAEGESSVTMRLGRQEMTYGSGRLIDTREGPTNRLSFDAMKAILAIAETKFDVFWGRPVVNSPDAFDDTPNDNRSLWGIYTVRPLDEAHERTLDVYYLGDQRNLARYHSGPGYETRNTLGARYYTRLSDSPWETNYEGMWQFGKFGDGDIQAWSVATATRYRFDDLLWKPKLGLRADVASGDRNPNDSTLNTFIAPYPSGAYFNLADPIGPANIYDIHPVLDLTLTDKLSLTLDWDFFWRQSTADGAYTLGGSPIPQSAASNSRFVGHSPSITTSYKANRHLSFLTSLVHFESGSFINQTTPGRSINYLTTWMAYKF